MLCASAFATLGDGGSGDKQVLTSLYYTDANYASLSNFNSLSTTVSGKQDKIPATTSTYVYNSTNNASADGSVVTTNTLGATGERGIAKAVVSNGSGGYTNDNWLPTVGAMMAAINAHSPAALTWTATETTAAGNYSTTFDGTTGNWPTADAGKLIDATGLATALSNKQNKIPAGSYGSNGSVLTYDSTAGSIQERWVLGEYMTDTILDSTDLDSAIAAPLSNNSLSGIANVAYLDNMSHPTLNEVKKGLVSAEVLGLAFGRKQNTIPAGTAGNVVTYTGTAGSVGSATVSSAATYNNGTLQNGSDIANITAVETKQNKKVCAGYEPGHDNDPSYCWLWVLPN
jgi:hypothetical protein